MNYDVRVNKITNPKSALVGFGTLVLEDSIEIDGFKIFSGRNGLFVKSPSEKQTKDGEEKYFDRVRFLGDKEKGSYNTPFQCEIFDSILAAYRGQEEPIPVARGAAGKANVEAAKAPVVPPIVPSSPAKKVNRPSFK